MSNDNKADTSKKNIKEAISKGKELLKSGNSKADVTRAIYPLIEKEDRDVICNVFQQAANLTEKGSMTYYYNCRRNSQKSS